MAFVTLVHGLMNIVAEIRLARIRNGKLYLFCSSMALVARAGGGKGSFAVVAGTAGLAFFHIGH